MKIMNFKKIDNKLFKISKQFKVISHIDPINSDLEKKKFFKNLDYCYNPVFSYIPLSFDIKKTKKVLSSIKIDKRFLVGKIFSEEKQALLEYIELIESRGNSKLFSRASKTIFGQPSKRTLQVAYKILNETLPEKSEKKTISVKRVVQEVKTRIRNHGFKNWHVKVKKHQSASMLVDSSTKEIVIKDQPFSKKQLKRLKVHEIGVHILRAENGSIQPYKILGTGLPGYLATEEGLASFAEKQRGVLSNSLFREYAGRAIAVSLALNKPFREVFLELKKYFNQEIAYRITERVKRGLVNTSRKGCFTKDHIYLTGMLAVEKYLKKGDIGLLYIGKVGIEHIPVIKKLIKKGVLRPPVISAKGGGKCQT